MIVILPLLVSGGGGKILTTSVFKRLSLASCAVILSLSNVSMADETTTQTPQPEREKAYTLTRVESEGENTITKIELNTDTGKFEPVYYRLDLTKTEYGTGDTTRYYEWTKTENGHTFDEVSAPTEGKTTITVHYDNKTSEKIYNTSSYEQGSIVSNFISQKADRTNPGGAISNNYDIKLIKGDFIENSTDEADGGAIFNAGNIGSIEGNFVGNISQYYTTKTGDYGGTIANLGYIGNITGNFINNSALGAVKGGAIYNESNGTIETITGDFIGNSSASDGGGIYNNGTIGDITGDFIGNYATSNGYIYGGAISNNKQINSITGNFIGNSVVTTQIADASGGAISNTDTINNITGDFIGNYATAEYGFAYGGAIYNRGGSIDNIQGNFINNYSYGGYGAVDITSSGGAIYNRDGIIGNITGDFIGNKAVVGGAICNYVDIGESTIGTVNGNFIGNKASNSGGGIYNSKTIGDITGDFIGNKSDDNGGAIANDGWRSWFLVKINNINASFYGNTAGENGGAIYNIAGYNGEVIIENITGDFIQNSAGINGGAIYNYNDDGNININSISGDFIGNHAENRGGAIYNYGSKIGTLDDKGNLVGGISGSFIGNYAKTTLSSGLALGGAVYTNRDMNFIADGKTHYISGNYTEDPTRGKVDNAIFVEIVDTRLNSLSETRDAYIQPTITFAAKNGGKYIIDDQIEGGVVASKRSEEGTRVYFVEYPDKYNLKLTGDKTGEIVLNNSVINADTTLDEVTLHLTKADILETSTLTANSGHLSLINGLAETQSMQGMTVNGHLGMSVDVDLANKAMDRLPENVTTVAPDGKIDVEYLNLLNDAKEDRTDILFAEESYKDKVSYTGKSPVAYSPIYKYDVSYNQDDGFFTFLRSSGGGNPSDAFNPTVLAPSVAAQAGAYATQMNTFNYAFQHSDNFMNLPFLERLALKESGRYASTTTNSFSPLYTRIESAGYWVKPYVSFESIPLKNGPKVDNINYGSLIGYDSKITPIAHGFDRVLSGYVGYNGANQSYSGVDSYQNGGLVGGTIFLYKGNFFNATTLSVGASVGESQNMYGNENYTMLLAGIGNRLGYNFEFKEGRYIIQPSMLMSYTFVNTFDYTNSAGVRMESDPLHAIQLAPGVKFIMNTKNGWQPYAAVNMVWNVLDKSDVRANDVRLPEMSIKPYVQYGLGVQKRIKDRFLAFGQAMVSNGGRNGVSLSFGLRWFLGD